MVIRTTGDLSRGAAFRWHNEQVAVTGLQVTLAITPVDQILYHASALRPLCATRRRRHLHEGLCTLRHEH